jgi:hypothetical protein
MMNVVCGCHYRSAHLLSKLRPLVLNAKLASSLPVFPFHTSKVHLPLILVPPSDQFRHVFRRMLLAAMAPGAVPAPAPAPAPAHPGLRKIAPYWYPYTTMAKGRWFNREILEIVSTEFRDRSIEYYVWFLFVLFAFFLLDMSTDGGEAALCCWVRFVEIRARVWRHYCQWQDRQA